LRRLSTILLFCISSLQAHSQHHVGAKLNGGISKVYRGGFDSEVYSQTIQLRPSGSLGLYYNFGFKKNIFGIDILFMQIEGDEKTSATLVGTSGFIETTEHIRTHISYLSLPIYYGLKFKKLEFNVGIQTSLTLNSGGSREGQSFSSSTGLTTTWDYEINKLKIDSFDFGPKGEIIFTVSSKFAFEGNYYHGVNNILRENSSDREMKVRQISVGIRYKLLDSSTN
jgi:hypothetical protein